MLLTMYGNGHNMNAYGHARTHASTQTTSIDDMTENGNEGLVHKPVRLEKKDVDRLEREAKRRGYKQVAPVMRLAIQKGLEVLEQQEI